jgi:hypothetical protein
MPPNGKRVPGKYELMLRFRQIRMSTPIPASFML